MSDKIANLVISVDLDTARIGGKLVQVKNDLDQLATAQARVSQQLEHTQQALNDTAASFASQKTEAQASQKAVAASVEETHRRVQDIIARTRQQADAQRALNRVQSETAKSYFRQIDALTSLNNNMESYRSTQARIREDLRRGNLTQQDYLALLADGTRRVKILRDEEEKSTQAKLKFINALKAQATAQRLTATEQLKLRAAQLGVSSQADIYIRKIDAVTHSMRRLGFKSAQVRRELGVVAAEVLRGDFGRLRGSAITLANRGGWLDGLFTVKGATMAAGVTALAGAALGLGRAWAKAREETRQFNQALAQTGGYIGYSRRELQNLSVEMAVQSTAGSTVSDYAKTLTEVAKTGVFFGEQAKAVARAAQEYASATGEAASGIISNFQRLRDAPLQTLRELDSQMHFLTASQLENIETLEKQGQTFTAGQEAVKLYARALEELGNKSLESMDKWNRLGGAIKSTVTWLSEAPKTLFMELTPEQQLAAMQIRWDEGRLLSESAKQEFEELKKRVAEYKAQQEKSRTQAQYNKSQLLREQEWKKWVDRFATPEQRIKDTADAWRAEAIAEQHSGRTDSEKLKQILASIDEWQANELKRVETKPARTERTPGVRLDAATRMLTQYRQQYAQVQQQMAAWDNDRNAKLTDAAKSRIALDEQIAGMKGRALTADEKSILANADKLRAELDQLDALQQQAAQRQLLSEMQAKGLDLSRQMADEAAQQARAQQAQLDTAGMGNKNRQRYQELRGTEDTGLRRTSEWNRWAQARGLTGTDEHRRGLEDIAASTQAAQKNMQDFYQQLDTANSDWRNGFTSAMENFVDQSQNVSQLAGGVFGRLFNGMTDSLTTFATTGKFTFKGFVKSVMEDLARMAAQIAVSRALTAVLGAFGGAASGAASGVASGTSIAGGAASGLSVAASGGVFPGNRGLSRYSGSVVDRPTFFAFARGAGLMGEAGPEAILPLRRGRDGKLGVVAAAGAGSGVFAPQYNIEIHNDGRNGQIGPEALQAVYELGKRAASDYMQQQSRDGGHLSGVWQ